MNLISIIVPFYNNEKTIDRCIQSILHQTYSNFELLMIDDSSSDHSPEIVRRYAGLDRRIHLTRQQHAGVSAARNLGLRQSVGEFIQFVDADDDIEPDMLEHMLGACLEKNADLVVCNFEHPSIKNYLGDCTLDFQKHRDRVFFYQNTFAAQVPWNKLYRRSIIREGFDEEVDFCEDGLFTLANMIYAKTVVSLSRSLYHYYVAPRDTALEESSCINKIAKAADFWLTKETYWYKCTRLLPKMKAILKKSYPRYEWDELLYTRAFDFMLWELLIFGSLQVDEAGLIKEMQAIFSEPEFLKSLAVKERYGVHFISLPKQLLNQKVESFVQCALDTYWDITNRNLRLRPYVVLMQLFSAWFLLPPAGPVNRIDLLAAAMEDLAENHTAEAQYTNRLLQNQIRQPERTASALEAGLFA